MEPPPPETEDELRLRARRLTGSTLSDLAGHLGERARATFTAGLLRRHFLLP
ncbi:MAG: hypothetical protein ACREXK_01710 [Gammaproteobacteria bacterium]